MDACAVCLENFEGDESVCNLKCGHKFHSKCLCIWLINKNATCPICRTKSVTCEHCSIESECSNIEQIISHDRETIRVIIKYLIKESNELKKIIHESEDRELARNIQLRNTFETVDLIMSGIMMNPYRDMLLL